jgi:hypothetical protein
LQTVCKHRLASFAAKHSKGLTLLLELALGATLALLDRGRLRAIDPGAVVLFWRLYS